VRPRFTPGDQPHDATANGKVCVCELVPLFELSQPTISHHLRVLRDAGLVASERQGLWACYYVLSDRLDELAAWLG
jgi:ArsR family transcriptional regulator, arsenate/arsenite/antimonite-responsive transcriptional repressor